jgi:hypothetical protein
MDMQELAVPIPSQNENFTFYDELPLGELFLKYKSEARNVTLYSAKVKYPMNSYNLIG